MTEFRKKLQKQEGWYAEGENFDILTARMKEGEKYHYTISVSISRKHKLYDKTRAKIMATLFPPLPFDTWYEYEYKRKFSFTEIIFHFPDKYDSLNDILAIAESVFNYLSNIK